MPFIPATPGIVGFGGGSKPAVFQAVSPQYLPMNQQTDDDGPFTRCHDALGDTLQFAISGVLVCSGCYPLDNALGPPRDMKFSISGVNGTGTATWNGSAWVATAGSVTITVFASTDGTCTGASFDTTSDLTIGIACQGDNQFGANIVANNVVILGFTWSVVAFFGAGLQPLGAPINSTLGSGDCGQDAFIELNAASDGTVTVTT